MLKLLKIFIMTLGICQIVLAGETTRVVGFKVAANPGKTKIIFNLSSKGDYDTFYIENPSRIVIDLLNTVMTTPINNSLLHNTIVKEIRYATHEDGTLRIVLDLRRNTHFNGKITSAKKGKFSLVLSLDDPYVVKKQTHKKEQLQVPLKQAEDIQSSVESAITKTPQTDANKSKPTDNASASAHDFTLSKPAKNLDLQQLRDIIIVIDPGHGGKDPGVSGVHKTREKTVVLAVAKELRRLLNMEVGIKAILTRSDDYFLPLKERLRIAHANKADLFISLHADAYKRHSISGVSVFALGENGATSEVASWLAAKENVSELENNLLQSAALRSVLFDLAQKNTVKTSLDIGNSIIEQLPAITKVHNHTVEQANFVVLKSSDIPSLLIETGFLSDPKEERKLKNQKYDSDLAKAIETGIFNYFKYNPLPNTYLSIISESHAETGKT